MMTPVPVPDSCDPDTEMVTTLGWIFAAAPATVPSALAVTGAVAVVVLTLEATVVLLLLSSTRATVPAPTPAPTRAAVTAATKMVRIWRCLGGFVAGGAYGPNAGEDGGSGSVSKLGCSKPP